MRKILKLTLSYLRFYKKQTLAMFAGIMMSSVLITGIGSMIYSGQRADLESARKDWGDWHYQILDETGISEKLSVPAMSDDVSLGISDSTSESSNHPLSNAPLNNNTLEKCGLLKVKKTVDEPYQVTFCTADANYMAMMGRTLTDGNYPQNPGEIALDYRTINNLGISDNIGNQVEICGSTYTLCGILTEGSEDSTGDMKLFVSENTVMDGEMPLLYLKFDESMPVYKQMETFSEKYNIPMKNVTRNNGVTAYVGGESPDSVLSAFKTAVSNPNAGLIYFLGNLNTSFGLADKTVFAALALFGAFVIYSLFGITIAKRKEQYAVLQVLGLDDRHLFALLLTELLLILIAAYPAGCLIGNGIASLIYSDISGIFSSQSENAMFFVSDASIRHGAFFFIGFVALTSFTIVRRMRRQSEAQLMKNTFPGKRINRKIYAKRSGNLTKTLTKRFMFGKLSTFAGIIISLSLGGVIFLGTSYAAESTKRNMNHTLKTDDQLDSDLLVYIDSENGSYSIPENAVKQIKNIAGIAHTDEMSYLLGEIPLESGIFQWPEFFPETANDPTLTQEQRILDNYHGIITQQNISQQDNSQQDNSQQDISQQDSVSYRLKVNVYGYSDDMLNALNDYLVEGTIDPGLIYRENSIILKTLTDGQGNTDGFDLHPGDTVRLKVPKTMSSPELLTFESDESEYIEKEFTIAAVVNRPIAKNDYFIGDSGMDQVDIIMSGRQMQENYYVNGYNNISINLLENADHNNIIQQIHSAVADLNRCMIKDNTELITRKNVELNQKTYFFYGIAVILLGISLLHIINSMKHTILSRRHEFGIIRAMGITDRGFRIMLIREGIRYGIYTSVLMMILYGAVHYILRYVMNHVFLYIIVENNLMLPQCFLMVCINILICTVTVILAGNEILREDIVKEI